MPPFSRKPLTVFVCCELIALAGGFVADAQAQAMQPLRVDPVLLGLPPAAPAPVAAPAPASVPTPVKEAPRAEVKPVEASVVELRDTESGDVAQPSTSKGKSRKASADEIPARAAAPAVAPEVAKSSPAPMPVEPAPVVTVVPATRSREDESAATSRAAIEPQSRPAPEPAQKSAAIPAAKEAVAAPASRVPQASTATQQIPAPRSSSVATMTPGTLPALQVHPGLLGVPVSPVVARAPATSPASPLVSGSGQGAMSSNVLPLLVPATGPRDEDEVADATPALPLRKAVAMVPVVVGSGVPLPVFISSQRMSGTVGSEFVAEGDAELRKIGVVTNADQLTYWPVDDEFEALGNVRLQQGADIYTGPKLRMKLDEQLGFFEQPTYYIKRLPKALPGAAPKTGVDGEEISAGFAAPRELRNTKNAAPAVLAMSSFTAVTTVTEKSKTVKTATEAHGEAERIDFEGENQVRIKSGTYTTCKPGDDGWYVAASDLKLDYDREVAEGKDGKVYFLGVPIVYSPWLSFSLNNERKSGLLSPTFGSTSQSGLELALPYYWNIAPDMDATITPRVLSKRGTQVNTEFRYLDPTYQGIARVESLPDDKARNGENRYSVSLVHSQSFAVGGIGLGAAINYNRVSDDNYFTDLSSRVANTSQTQLLQQGTLGYGTGWWNVTANVQSYQTLQPDPKNLVAAPYRMLPQITVNARQPDLYRTESSFFGQYTSFAHPGSTMDQGQRTVLYPQVALPYVTPGWYVTPKLGVHMTQYSLDRRAPGSVGPDSINRTMPIASVDSGMTFERTSNWFSRDYTQTLEPRLYYLNIPYREQSKIPVFDSGLADFNFARIFSENQFAGQDRINNANQLTAAVTSRLIDPASGNEIMRAMFGQRFYFSQEKVTLPGTTVDPNGKWDKSDFLAAFSGQILPKVYADTTLQYGAGNHQVEQYSLGARYLPEPGKVLNASYRYTRENLDQVDVSAQWPVFGGWHAVGRMNYSFKDGRAIENIGGLEYNGGCWVVRAVGQRLATTDSKASSALFVQLELTDFSRIGSNPLELLRRNIQGYGMVNQSTADPVFGQ